MSRCCMVNADHVGKSPEGFLTYKEGPTVATSSTTSASTSMASASERNSKAVADVVQSLHGWGLGTTKAPTKAPGKSRRFSKLLSTRPSSLRSKPSVVDKATPTADTTALPAKTPHADFFRRFSRNTNVSSQHCPICEESLALLVSGERVVSFNACGHTVHANCAKRDAAQRGLVSSHSSCPKCTEMQEALKLPMQSPVLGWSTKSSMSLPGLSPGRVSVATASARSVAMSTRSMSSVPLSQMPPVPRPQRPSTPQALYPGMRVPYPKVTMALATMQYDQTIRDDQAAAAGLLTELMMTVSIPELDAHLDRTSPLTPPMTNSRSPTMSQINTTAQHFPMHLIVLVQVEAGELQPLQNALLKLCEQLEPYDGIDIIAFNAAGEHNIVCSLNTNEVDRTQRIMAMKPAFSIQEAVKKHDRRVFDEAWQSGGLEYALQLAVAHFGRDKQQIVQQQLFLLTSIVPEMGSVALALLRKRRMSLHIFDIWHQESALYLYQLAHGCRGQYHAVQDTTLLSRCMLGVLLGSFSLVYTQLCISIEILDEAGQPVSCSMSSPHLSSKERPAEPGLHIELDSLCLGETRNAFLKINTDARHLYCQITVRGQFTNQQVGWTGLTHLVIPVHVQRTSPPPLFQMRKLEELAGAMIYYAVDLLLSGREQAAEHVIQETRRVLLKNAERQTQAVLRRNVNLESATEDDSTGRILALDGDLETWLMHMSRSGDSHGPTECRAWTIGLELGRVLLHQQAWMIGPHLTAMAARYARCYKTLRKELMH